MITFDPTQPTDSSSPRLGAADMRTIVATILQWFGYTGLTAASVTNAPFSFDAAGDVNLNGQPTVTNPPITSLGIANKGYVDAGTIPGNYGVTSGTNAYTVTLASNPSSLAALQGSLILLSITNGNTGSATLAPNGLAATPIEKGINGSLVQLGNNDLPTGSLAVISYDGTVFELLGVTNQVPQFDGLAGVRGLTGSSAGGTTQITLSANVLALRPNNASYVMKLPGFAGGATLDISTAGSILNGRDQSASFANGSTIHVYAIAGLGQTTGLLASLSATSPTLPTNYTVFGYLTSFIMSGANIPALYVDGNTVYYAIQQNVLSLGASSSEANISLAGAVPVNALAVKLQVTAAVKTTAAVNFDSGVVKFRLTTGDDYFVVSPWAYSLGTRVLNHDTTLDVPNNLSGQNLIYIWTTVPSTAGFGASVWVLGYTVPNNA